MLRSAVGWISIGQNCISSISSADAQRRRLSSISSVTLAMASVNARVSVNASVSASVEAQLDQN